jgi:hypothetical protein
MRRGEKGVVHHSQGGGNIGVGKEVVNLVYDSVGLKV